MAIGTRVHGRKIAVWAASQRRYSIDDRAKEVGIIARVLPQSAESSISYCLLGMNVPWRHYRKHHRKAATVQPSEQGHRIRRETTAHHIDTWWAT